MKLLLEIKTEQTPSKNDIIMWNGSEWTAVSRDTYLKNVSARLTALSKRLDEVETRLDKKDEQINTLAKTIGGKLP